MMLHEKMYLAQSQFQKGTRVRHAATELQTNPDILAIEIKSQAFAFFYRIPLLLVFLNKADSTRNGLFFVSPQLLGQLPWNSALLKPSNV